MRRFFVEDIRPDATHETISGDEFTHLKKVLRLAEGAKVELFNGKGLTLTGTIESIEKDRAVVKIEGKSEGERESPAKIILLQGMLKGEKPELVIQKTTELGVREIVFFSTPRTVAVISEGKAGAKLNRWKKVAAEAAKQCSRAALPELRTAPFGEVLKGHGQRLKLMLWEGHGGGGLKDALKRPEAKNGVAVLVGPEGGFSETEVAEAQKAGFIAVGLGPRVLRAETAAISIVTIAQYELGDLG